MSSWSVAFQIGDGPEGKSQDSVNTATLGYNNNRPANPESVSDIQMEETDSSSDSEGSDAGLPAPAPTKPAAVAAAKPATAPAEAATADAPKEGHHHKKKKKHKTEIHDKIIGVKPPKRKSTTSIPGPGGVEGMNAYMQFCDDHESECDFDLNSMESNIALDEQKKGISFFGDNEVVEDPAAYQRLSAVGKMKTKIRGALEHIGFRLFTVILIMIDLALVIADLSQDKCVSSANIKETLSHAIISFFLLEVILRVFTKGKDFFYVILDVIDMVVVILSFILDMVFLALSPDECDEEHLDQKGFARLVIIGRVVRIIRIMRIIYIGYTQRRHVSTAARQLVSQNKRRYQKDGFDLDLCYVTERVIAMSFPSKGSMAIYRNPIEEVSRFFNTKHANHYRIYNLCSERTYDVTLFNNCVKRIFIDDHNVPKAAEMIEFAEDCREWMAADPENVIAIHCKGGKGRTGTMICVWLIECGLFDEAQNVLEYFGERRTDLTKGETFQGVETPSQSRYVGYFELIKSKYDGELPPPRHVKLKSFRIDAISAVGNGDGSDLQMEIREGNKPMYEANLGKGTNCKVVKLTSEDAILIKTQNMRPVEGDIKVMFKTDNKKIPIGYDKCPFYFWFNTRFVEGDELKLTRSELDNPHKPKTHTTFKWNFAVTVYMQTVDPANNKEDS